MPTSNELVQLGIPKTGHRARRPDWLRIKVDESGHFREVTKTVKKLKLHTVCEEARCPNIWECWGKHRTATFMILGDTCTRACRYCSVNSGRPNALDPDEPRHVGEAVLALKLQHAVITSVDRDDLPDFGAHHWAETVKQLRTLAPKTTVEILTPDFNGVSTHLETILDSEPHVFSHNIETVERLHKRMRSRGDFDRSINVLNALHSFRISRNQNFTTKTGLMLGLGETIPEVLQTMDALRAVSCDVLTLGQYLNPTKKHAPIARFYSPDEFAQLKTEGLARGFKHVESGPLVRSSYHAHEHAPKNTA